MNASACNARIDAMVARFMVLSSDSDETVTWTPVCQEPGLEVHKLEGADNCFKVIAELGSTPETAFDILSDITRRSTWDELCESGHVIEQLNGSTRIQYMRTKAMWPTASRDVVSIGYVGVLGDGRYLNVTGSVEHPDYPPNTGSAVRMEARIAGQVIGPSLSGHKDTCSIIQVADGDLKGWIPSTLISFIATKAVPASFRKLNAMVSKLEVVTESKVLLMSREPGAYNALSDEKMASAATVVLQDVEEKAVVIEKKAVVAAPPSLFYRLTAWLELASPWLITILFARVVWRMLNKRRLAYK